MEQTYNYTIGDKQYTRDELLAFGKQHYPKFYWIKRGVGLGLLSIGLLTCLIMIIVFSAYGWPVEEGAVGMYIGSFATPAVFAIVGVILVSVSFISLPDESYIKHAVDYYTKLDRLTKQNEMRKTQKNSGITADQLLKYKELLDKGAITQEEYDAKKKELL